MRISDWSSDVCSSDLPSVLLCCLRRPATARCRVDHMRLHQWALSSKRLLPCPAFTMAGARKSRKPVIFDGFHRKKRQNQPKSITFHATFQHESDLNSIASGYRYPNLG